MERRGDGKRETERLERGRSRTEDKIDYRREAGTRTYVEGARAQSGDKTDRNTSTIHRAWGGFLFEHPPPRSSALLIRLNVATDLTRRTRDSLISVAIISVMQRRGVAREIIFLLACVFSPPFSFGFRFSRGHWSVWKITIHPSRCVPFQYFHKRTLVIQFRGYNNIAEKFSRAHSHASRALRPRPAHDAPTHYNHFTS